MQETLGQLSAVALSAFDLDVEFVVFGMVTERCVRLTVEGPSRRGSRVVVVTDAVQPLVPPKGTQILKDLQSRMQAVSPLSRCWLLCVTTISAELSPGLLLISASLLEPKLDGLTGPSLTQIILSPTRTENVLSEGWRPLSGHAVWREPADAMVF